jgi:hypothetical protein
LTKAVYLHSSKARTPLPKHRAHRGRHRQCRRNQDQGSDIGQTRESLSLPRYLILLMLRGTLDDKCRIWLYSRSYFSQTLLHCDSGS